MCDPGYDVNNFIVAALGGARAQKEPLGRQPEARREVLLRAKVKVTGPYDDNDCL